MSKQIAIIHNPKYGLSGIAEHAGVGLEFWIQWATHGRLHWMPAGEATAFLQTAEIHDVAQMNQMPVIVETHCDEIKISPYRPGVFS